MTKSDEVDAVFETSQSSGLSEQAVAVFGCEHYYYHYYYPYYHYYHYYYDAPATLTP